MKELTKEQKLTYLKIDLLSKLMERKNFPDSDRSKTVLPTEISHLKMMIET